MIIQVEKSMKTVKGKLILCSVIVFAFSVLMFIFNYPGTKATFIFESMDSGTLYTETRYIPDDTTQGDLHYFVDELLLGPVSNRYKPLFSNGTKALSCFLTEDNVLYINLNENALFQGNSSSESLYACDLLKKNVFKNYKYVDIIKVFIMGKLVS